MYNMIAYDKLSRNGTSKILELKNITINQVKKECQRLYYKYHNTVEFYTLMSKGSIANHLYGFIDTGTLEIQIEEVD